MIPKMGIKRITILLLLILGVALFVNFQSLNYYFFQDDWFILNDLKTLNPLTIFLPRNDIIYYRPIGIQTFFLVSKNLFGLNPLGYHVLGFGAFMLSLVLIYKITFQLTAKKLTGLLAALLYGTAGMHYMALSWLSLSWNYIGLAFFLMALKFSTSFIETNNNKYALGAFVFFILCLFSTEFALVFPFFVIGIIFGKNIKLTKQRLILYFKTALPYVFTVFVYFLIRVFVIPIPAEGVYRPEVGSHIFKHYIWYFLWTINVPEIFKYHLSLTNLTLTSEMLSATQNIVKPMFALIFAEFILLACSSFLYLRKVKVKLVGIAACLFAIALAPVISLPHHTYVYYLTFAALPVIFLISVVVDGNLKSKNKLSVGVAVLLIISWVILSINSKTFNEVTHWVPAEQVVSRKIVQAALQNGSKNPSVIVIYPSSKLVKLSLLDQQAMKLVFGEKVKTKFIETLDGHSVAQGDTFIMWDRP